MSIPSVTAARYVADYRLDVTFSDGTRKVVDFSQWLRGPIFEPIKDVEYFKKFILDGWTISWPNGADIAPEALYASQEALTVA